MKNLVKLAPRLTELRVFDNSIDGDPKAGRQPELRELLHATDGRLESHCDLLTCPHWVKPVLAVLAKR